jgi:hypothetical protein
MTRLELGRGIVARGHIQPVDLAARVAAATTRVLDGSFSDGVDAGRAAMRALPGVDAAVATILSLG